MTHIYMSNKQRNKQAHISTGNGFFGGLIGRGLGFLGEKVLGKTKGIDGQELGSSLGSKIIPFKKGGKVGKVVMTPMGAMMVPAAPKKAKRKATGKAKGKARK
jgi:hypothetical protein